MHYFTLAILKRNAARRDLAGAVEEVVKPYKERGLLDWYQIGGRWTGELSDYKPEEDPLNIETCDLCVGTGFRADPVGAVARADNASYTCNGCGTYDHETKLWGHGKQGPGRRVKWPTHWVRYPGDVMRLADAIEKLERHKYQPFYVFTEMNCFMAETWNGFEFVKTPDYKQQLKKELTTLAQDDEYVAVVVDCHS